MLHCELTSLSRCLSWSRDSNGSSSKLDEEMAYLAEAGSAQRAGFWRELEDLVHMFALPSQSVSFCVFLKLGGIVSAVLSTSFSFRFQCET